jgi:hypothetical protein
MVRVFDAAKETVLKASTRHTVTTILICNARLINLSPFFTFASLTLYNYNGQTAPIHHLLIKSNGFHNMDNSRIPVRSIAESQLQMLVDVFFSRCNDITEAHLLEHGNVSTSIIHHNVSDLLLKQMYLAGEP